MDCKFLVIFVNKKNYFSAENISEKVPLLEEKDSGVENSMAEEKKDSLSTFFILLVLILAILLVHLLIIVEFHYMPESLAIVLLGLLILY